MTSKLNFKKPRGGHRPNAGRPRRRTIFKLGKPVVVEGPDKAIPMTVTRTSIQMMCLTDEDGRTLKIHILQD